MLAATVMLCATPGVTFAQDPGGTILGTVIDESGGVLPGAAVRAINVGTGLTRSVFTDSRGSYRLPALLLGEYVVETELAGFRTAVRSGIVLTVGREAVVNVTMQLGDMEMRVIVTAEAPLVQSTTSELGGLITADQLQALPINQRGFENLAYLQPGVTFYAQGASSEKMSISGSRPNQISIYMDGTDISASDQTVGTDRLGMEAIQEFRVLTHNYSAAYGKTGGGIIETVSRSGTNNMRGSVYNYHRNSALDAKNFFDPADESLPPFTRYQFGVALGGPVKVDRTHFFANYEGLRERLSRTHIAGVPSASARQGLLPDPRNPGTLLNVGVAAAVRPYLELYPMPNGRDFGDGTAEHLFSFTSPTDEHYATFRIDHKLAEADSLLARYTVNWRSSESPRPQPGFVGFSERRDQYATIENKHIFSDSLLNTMRLGVIRNRSESDSYSQVPLDPSLSFMPGEDFGWIVIRGGISELGFHPNAPRFNSDTTVQFDNEISYTRGSHFLKTGFHLRRFHLNRVVKTSPRGIYEFNTIRDFLEGRSRTLRAAMPESDNVRFYRQWLVGWFVQDDWAVGPRLTLNLGLRHEIATSPTEEQGRLSTMRSPLDPTWTLVTEDEPYYDFDRHALARNYAPRVGLAWDVFGDGRTSVRAGYGWFHNQMVGFYYSLWGAQAPPFDLTSIISTTRFPDGYTLLTPSSPRMETLNPSDTPLMQHYSVGVQRQLGSGIVASAGYVGSRGKYLERRVDWNIRQHQVLPDGRIFYPAGAPYINPNFAGGIGIRTTDANSWYSALQAGLTLRSRHGQVQTSYTWAKNMDDGSGTQNHQTAGAHAGTPQNKHCLSCEKSLSAMHVAHNLVVSSSYQLPWGDTLGGVAKALLAGWQLNGIMTLATGSPFTAELGFNRSRDGQISTPPDRPNLRSGASLNPILGGPDRYFDPNAFELQPEGFYGNVGRNTLSGPGLAMVDFALAKHFEIGDSGTRRASFRVEWFNILNRANFDTPFRRPLDANGNILGRAGRIDSTVTTARQMQLAVRFEF